MKGIELIEVERLRQTSDEGWSSEHDDNHSCGELAMAARCYKEVALSGDLCVNHPRLWPWAKEWWKPSSVERCLVKSGALYQAEIERLYRRHLHNPPSRQIGQYKKQIRLIAAEIDRLQAIEKLSNSEELKP